MTSRSLVLCGLLLIGTGASAEERQRVLAGISGDPRDVQAVTASLRELLQRLDLTLEVLPVLPMGQAPGVLAWVTVGLSGTTLQIDVEDGARALRVHKRLTRTGTRTMQLEVVAHVVQSAVQDLQDPLERAARRRPETATSLESTVPLVSAEVNATPPIPVARVDPPVARVEPAPVPREAPREPPNPAPPREIAVAAVPDAGVPEAVAPVPLVSAEVNAAAPLANLTEVAPAPVPPLIPGARLDLAALGGVRLWNLDVSPAADVGASLSFQFPIGTWKPSLALYTLWNAQVIAFGTNMVLRSQALSARLAPALEVAHLGLFRLDAALGGGIDLFVSSIHPMGPPPPRPPPDRLDVAPILMGAVTAHFDISPRFGLLLTATLDADLAPKRFVSDTDMGREVLFEPWRFRPAFLVGVSFDTLGASP